MQADAGMIAVGIFLVIVGISAAVEQRRAAKVPQRCVGRIDGSELVELQRETHRLLTLIAEKLDRTQK